jgi:hypothetical protein
MASKDTPAEDYVLAIVVATAILLWLALLLWPGIDPIATRECDTATVVGMHRPDSDDATPLKYLLKLRDGRTVHVAAHGLPYWRGAEVTIAKYITKSGHLQRIQLRGYGIPCSSRNARASTPGLAHEHSLRPAPTSGPE